MSFSLPIHLRQALQLAKLHFSALFVAFETLPFLKINYYNQEPKMPLARVNLKINFQPHYMAA